MAINDERDVVLNALYHHFGKDRISYDRIYDYLKANTTINENRIIEVLDGLTPTYVHHNVNHLINEYKILPQGEEIVEGGGFVGKAQKESHPTISINTGGGNVQGNAIGNQSLRDLSFENNITNTGATIAANTQGSSIKSQNFTSRIWWWINEHKVIAGIVSGLILFVVTYFGKPYLDGKFKTQQKQPIQQTSTPAK